MQIVKYLISIYTGCYMTNTMWSIYDNRCKNPILFCYKEK